MAVPDTTTALVIIPRVIAITISHSAATATNAAAMKRLAWRQLVAEVANVARPGAAGRMVTPRCCWRPFRCSSDWDEHFG